MANWAGIQLEGGKPKQSTAQQKAETVKANAVPDQAADTSGTEEGKAKARAYIAECQKHIADAEAAAYLEGRGYTVEEAKLAALGYDTKARAIVFPYRDKERCYYQQRFTWKDGNGKTHKPPTREVGPEPIYNAPALNTEEGFVFVTEGPFDALAILSEGYSNVVSLGGVGNARKLASALQDMARKPHIVIALDQDEPGRKAAEELEAALQQVGASSHVMEWDGEAKDPDEQRKSDREAFRAVLRREYACTYELVKEDEEKALDTALEGLKVVNPYAVAENIFLCRGAMERTPTGFSSLDKALKGGLPVGLVTLGAISSTGKTTLCLQMADQIAASGRDVLFVSIEQSARELQAKSLSRYTWHADKKNAISHSDIDDPTARAGWGKAKQECLNKAFNSYYAEVLPHIHFLEGLQQPTVASIRTVAETFCEYGRKAPVVFVDYLQLLAPPNDRMDDKRATDANVWALRNMGKELQTPVVCISSLNRASYSGVVDMAAFKESGAIEYSSDLLLGLQPYRMGEELTDLAEGKLKRKANELINKHKAQAVRSIELTILKNRSGAMPDEALPFFYNAPCNVIDESEAAVRFANR